MKRAVTISLLVLLTGGVFGNFLRYSKQPPDRPVDFSVLPMEKDGYLGDEHWFDSQSYEVLKADTSTLRRYGNPAGGSVWLFVAYFSSQKYGSQMHSPKHCLPGGGWRIDRQEKFTLSLSGGQTPVINRLLIKEGDRTELMLYWFVTRSGLLHSEFAVKWHLMMNALRFRPTDAAFVRVTLPVEYGNVEAATAEATAFLNCFYDDINRALPFEN